MTMAFFLDAVTLHQLFHGGLVPFLFFCGSRRGTFTSSVALSGDITEESISSRVCSLRLSKKFYHLFLSPAK